MEATTLRKPSIERRGEIAEAALRIVGERGRGALTTARLADEVGLTTGALFRHFATLDDVLRASVRLAIVRIEATFPGESAPPLSRLLELSGSRMRLLVEDRGVAWLLRSEQAQLTIPEDVLAELQRLARRSRRFLLAALREGAADGSIRADVDPEILLMPVMGTIHAFVGMPGVHRRIKRTRDRDPEAVLAALARLLAPENLRR